MFGEEGYSRLVGFLKITLPLAALALMSTIFLFARAPSTDTSIPYADIEDIAREPRLSEPQVSGVAEDGSVVEVTAQTARPTEDGLTIEGLRTAIEAVDGTLIHITAGTGEIDNATRIVTLSGLARIETSNGFEMETMGLTADIATGTILTDGALEVQAPFGTLTAGQLRIETPSAEQGQVMLFQNGVRLIYLPEQ
ncbi:MAG: hypothetical protein AAGL89_05715 [Pseudomonadota bacterium]